MFSISEIGFGKYESQRQHSELAGKLRVPVFVGLRKGGEGKVSAMNSFQSWHVWCGSSR